MNEMYCSTYDNIVFHLVIYNANNTNSKTCTNTHIHKICSCDYTNTPSNIAVNQGQRVKKKIIKYIVFFIKESGNVLLSPTISFHDMFSNYYPNISELLHAPWCRLDGLTWSWSVKPFQNIGVIMRGHTLVRQLLQVIVIP